MDRRRIRKLEKTLDKLYKHWDETRRETIAQLGEDEALKILNLHGNNWIDIHSWISSQYNKDEQMNIVGFQFFRLYKEIYWLQFLFHTANYSTAYRNLRYIWEMMSQAYYVDLNHPRLTLDEQLEKARQIEVNIYGWKIVMSTLCAAFNLSEIEIRANFKPLWQELNKHVHPSALQMDIVATEDFSGLITDSFNDNLARDCLTITNGVFDIVYAIMFKRFVKTIELARNYKFISEWNTCLPITTSIIREYKSLEGIK